MILSILLFLTIMAWMNERDLRDAERPAIENAKRSEIEAYRILAHVLNEKPIFDTVTRTMLFIEVSHQEGL